MRQMRSQCVFFVFIVAVVLCCALSARAQDPTEGKCPDGTWVRYGRSLSESLLAVPGVRLPIRGRRLRQSKLSARGQRNKSGSQTFSGRQNKNGLRERLNRRKRRKSF